MRTRLGAYWICDFVILSSFVISNSSFLPALGRLRDALVRLLGRLGPQRSSMFTALGTVGRLFTPMRGSPNDECPILSSTPRKTAIAKPRFARESSLIKVNQGWKHPPSAQKFQITGSLGPRSFPFPSLLASISVD